eukprot:TRINITY_DN2742_c0_g1_i1.p1 TRINITY_DN2742_c0_g1~~TRINITY_DN2742_c0_g1_i1.p1  ORF type:complete len:462 (+),score=111.03 TRINITY_DN2742_c0_g1_i1:907-2292(+)
MSASRDESNPNAAAWDQDDDSQSRLDSFETKFQSTEDDFIDFFADESQLANSQFSGGFSDHQASNSSGYSSSPSLEAKAQKKLKEALEMVRQLQDENERIHVQLEKSERLLENNTSVEGNLNRLLTQGSPYYVAGVQSVQEKRDLLTAAVECGDYNALITVILHLQTTCQPRLFFECISGTEEAFDMYTKYLLDIRDFKTLANLYDAMDDHIMHGLTKFRHAMTLLDLGQRYEQLEAIHELFKEYKETWWATQIKDYMNLLKRQLPIEDFDSKAAASGKEQIYIDYPRPVILGKPLHDTLYYCLFYHPFASKDKLSSPQGIKDAFDVNDRRYLWITLKARGHVRDWDQLKAHVTSKGLFGRISYASEIGFVPFVEICAAFKAPTDVLQFFCGLIEDNEQRFYCARDHYLWDIAIDSLVKIKDYQRIIQFKNYLVEQLGAMASQDLVASIDAATSKGRWKNK